MALWLNSGGADAPMPAQTVARSNPFWITPGLQGLANLR